MTKYKRNGLREKRKYENMAFGQMKLNVSVTEVWKDHLAKFPSS